MEVSLAARLEAERVHVLTGVTAPLRELMLWRCGQSEEERDSGPCPRASHASASCMLDDFVSYGLGGLRYV